MSRCAIGTLRYREEQERLSQIRETRRREALALKAIQDAEKKKLEQLIEDAQRWQQAEAIRAFLHVQEANVLKTGAISDQQSSHLAWAAELFRSLGSKGVFGMMDSTTGSFV
jgi:hypothetical protein